MNWFSMLALCASVNSPTEIDCDSIRTAYKDELANLVLSPTDLDAITRTAYAEAANQGSLGLSGIVFTILNRRISGNFGDSIEGIVNQKQQFEPVTKAGGWENLPQPSPSQQARIETIIELAKSSYLMDPTNGALYFQNASIVAQRVENGAVSNNLVHFGGSPVSATIEDHTFYALMCNTPVSTGSSDKSATSYQQFNNVPSTGVKQLRGGSNSN